MNIKLRKANERDIGIISKLLHRYDLFEHKLDARIEVDSERKYKKDLLQMFKDKSDTFILAEDGPIVVGLISYTIWKQGSKKASAIGDIFIIDAYRRKGIGKRLIRYVLKELKRQKCRFVQSGVRPKNKIGIDFWQKQGFKINYQPGYSMGKRLR
jgi:ribosomal protein S18 acetylase RimI-like enzyme